MNRLNKYLNIDRVTGFNIMAENYQLESNVITRAHANFLFHHYRYANLI